MTLIFFFSNKVASIVTLLTRLSSLAWTVLELIYFIFNPSIEFLWDYGFSFFALFYVYLIIWVHYLQKDYRDEMESMIDEQFWNFKCCGSEFYEYLETRALAAKKLARVQFLLALTCGLLFWPFESDRRDLFFILEFTSSYCQPFHRYYRYMFFSSLSWGTTIVLTYVNIYTFYNIHLDFQYQLLIKHMKNIDMGFETDIFSVTYQEEIERRLNICCSHLQKLTKFRQIFSTLLCWIFFFVFWVGLGVSMFLAYLLIVVSICPSKMNNRENVIALGFLWFMVAEMSVFLSFLSQRYVDMAEDFCHTLSECNWYQWNNSNKKTFLILLMYSQNYKKFSTRGLMAYDISLMIMMLQKTFSALTFFRAVRRRNKIE